jgi:hypothetical protein
MIFTRLPHQRRVGQRQGRFSSLIDGVISATQEGSSINCPIVQRLDKTLDTHLQKNARPLRLSRRGYFSVWIVKSP